VGYLRETRTRTHGTGFLRVRVRVRKNLPAGYPCPSLCAIQLLELLNIGQVACVCVFLLLMHVWRCCKQIEHSHEDIGGNDWFVEANNSWLYVLMYNADLIFLQSYWQARSRLWLRCGHNLNFSIFFRHPAFEHKYIILYLCRRLIYFFSPNCLQHLSPIKQGRVSLPPLHLAKLGIYWVMRACPRERHLRRAAFRLPLFQSFSTQRNVRVISHGRACPTPSSSSSSVPGLSKRVMCPCLRAACRIQSTGEGTQPTFVEGGRLVGFPNVCPDRVASQLFCLIL